MTLEAAGVPLGCLCAPDDVAALALYLLSAEARFVSEQVMGLTRRQL